MSRQYARTPEPLPARVIDNHTHLEAIAPLALARGATAFTGPTNGTSSTGGPSHDDSPISAYLRAARAAGVEQVIQIGCDLDSARASVVMAREHELRIGVALHPNEVVAHHRIDETSPDGREVTFLPRHVPYAQAFEQIAALARDPRVCAVSETGLDFFRAGERGRVVQREAFRDHIALAKDLGLPMQVHDREAHREILEVLDADGAPERTIIHSFSGDVEFAQECLRRGLWLSFSGTVTFKNATVLADAARIIPAEYLLVETDAPYLTPHPNRGRINHPAQLANTVRFLADLRQVDLTEFCGQITATTEQVYGA